MLMDGLNTGDPPTTDVGIVTANQPVNQSINAHLLDHSFGCVCCFFLVPQSRRKITRLQMDQQKFESLFYFNPNHFLCPR